MEKTKVETTTPIDAIINIFLSRDKLQASINIEPPKDGGKEPDLGAIKSALESKGIQYGINEKLLEDISDDPIYNKDIVIAKGSKGYKSKIVGGRCIAGNNIETNNLGSIACVSTYIQIGTDSSSISRQQELLDEIPALESKMKSLTSLISLLREYKDAGRLIGAKKTSYIDALYSYKEIAKQLESHKRELGEITDSIREKGYGRVVCRDTVYPGVSIKIGSQHRKISNEMHRKSFYHTEKGIRVGDL